MLPEEARRLAALAPGALTIKCTDWSNGHAIIGASRFIAGYVPDLSIAVVPAGHTDWAMELYNDWLLEHLCHPDPDPLASTTKAWRGRHGLSESGLAVK